MTGEKHDIPEARCARHGFAHPALAVERNYPSSRGSEWKAHCPGCVDYDWQEDGGYIPGFETGYGSTPIEAIDAYADECGKTYDEVVYTGEQHV